MSAPAGLETYGGTVANLGTGQGCREGRWAARAVLRGLSHRETVRKCGRVAVGAGMRLRVSTDAAGAVTGAGWAGLATCGSPWVCPVCSAKVAAVRMADLQAGVEDWVGPCGGQLAMLTVTIRHRKGQPLATLWDAVSGAWRRFVRSGTYRRLVAQLGVVGYVRATEVTYGRHGWHVHLHVLYFVDAGPWLWDAARGVRDQLVDLWLRAVGAQGFSALDAGQDFRVFRGGGEALRAGAEYLVKSTYTPRGAAAEVAGGAYKDARAGGDTPFGIAGRIVDAVEEGREVDPRDCGLWAEWDRASAGRRQLIWSRGLRDALGLAGELTDEEAAALELEGVDVLAVDGPDAGKLLRSGRLAAWVLDAAERARDVSGAGRVAADVLTCHGVRWSWLGAASGGLAA